jgi:iron-sulfur cluster assembly protein
MATAARPRPQIMTLTDAAATRVREIMASKPQAVGLKIGLKKGGCAGMEYTLEWAEEIAKFDEVIEEKGARIIIDPMATLYILGTEMDYQIDKLSAQFVFNNPNQTSACGCGESVELRPRDQAELDQVKA